MSKEAIRVILTSIFFLLFLINPRGARAQEVKFVVTGHIYPAVNYPNLLRAFINQVNELKPDAVFLLGDSVHDGTEKDWEILNQYLSKLESSYHLVPGNHDLQSGGKPRKLWMEEVGYLHKSVIINDYKFILLNTISEKGKYSPDKEEIKFLKKELIDYKNYQQVFLMFHHELWMYPYINWEKEIYPIIKGKVTNVFAGNLGYHFYSRLKNDQNITYFSNGFPKKKFYKEKPTFILANAKGKELETKLILVDLPADDPYYQINPEEKKSLSESIVDYCQNLGERVKKFGKKLLFVFVSFSFVLGFLISKLYTSFISFIRNKIIKKRKLKSSSS